MESETSQVVRADDLADYLAQHGLRVVRGGWRWGEHHPYLIVVPAQSVTPAEAEVEQPREE